MPTVSVRMDPELHAELETVAQETHQSKSALIKKALALYLDHVDGIIGDEGLERPVTPPVGPEELLREYGLL